MELNLKPLVDEFCARHPGTERAAVEAAMTIGAIAAAEHGARFAKERLQELQTKRERANRPQ